ncbi:DUF4148 domain-containing protein [Trinickia terrae]|uniref:DUF4148 domain-containing protein n=1 Tax=Trinickia terrae TaxID=2571161 RepID=A0A4V5PJ27_9BURK|nr:DUF4148 domain-containing protein [Trinickia terrae]TKC86880.1 DUF4148 domain-containing protein [Trinickia terrae]
MAFPSFGHSLCASRTFPASYCRHCASAHGEVSLLLKESIMKVTTLLNRSAIATLLLSASLTAFAGGGGPRGPVYRYSSGASNLERVSANTAPTVAVQADATSVAGANTATGKTRAQVQTELLQAREAGWLPTGNAHYPPSAEMRERNRVQFQQAENWWRAHDYLNAAAQ